MRREGVPGLEVRDVAIKICGLREPGEARAAAAAGAEYIGVVFAGRVRRVTPGQAGRVVAALPSSARAVGVFVDAGVSEVLSFRDRVRFGIAQLHGHEAPETCAALREEGLEVWKALRPRSREELETGFRRFGAAADALLIEGYSARAEGGTGSPFPWEWLTGSLRGTDGPRLVLAGGLRADNVADAIRRVRPDVVDVSSGVERAPGVKSEALILRFVEAVRASLAAPGAGEAP